MHSRSLLTVYLQLDPISAVLFSIILQLYIIIISYSIKKRLLAIALIISTGLLSCGSQADRATTLSEQAVATETGAQYAVNIEESQITWKVAHKGGLNPRFGVLSLEQGTLSFHDHHIEAGAFVINMNTIKVDRASVDKDEDVAKLEAHLKNSDFFDIEHHPSIDFKITKVEDFDPNIHSSQMSNANQMISGNLNILGTSVNITFPAYISFDGERAFITAQFIADRSEWGLVFGTKDKETGAAINPTEWAINKDMEIGIHLIAEKKRLVNSFSIETLIRI